MSRQIIIDEDTLVGYDYQTDRFYVVNKGTTTYRNGTGTDEQTGKELIKAVLDIVAPDNTVTLEDLQELYDNPELLTETSYTLSDTGAYRASVQINDYFDNPIVLEAEKHALYIKNTELNFNLTLNEPMKTRVEILIKYFRDNFGILLTTEQVTNIYEFLIDTYKPTVYNLIEDITTEPIIYSNKFRTSNYTNKKYKSNTYPANFICHVDYICSTNPYNIFHKPNIADIILVEPSYNKITYINGTEDISSLEAGDTVYITGTTVTEDTYTYTADGEYTVASVDTEKGEIVTTEAISSSYVFPYPQGYALLGVTGITKIDREESSIEIPTAIPDIMTIGSIIEVRGTQQEIEGTVVSCDGIYTIASVDTEHRLIYTQETMPTSYTYSGSGTQATVSKQQFIGEVKSAIYTDNHTPYDTLPFQAFVTLTFTQDLPVTPTDYYVEMPDGTRTYYTKYNMGYTVAGITEEARAYTLCGTITSYTGTEPLKNYTPVYPHLQASIPDTAILIQVVNSDNTDLMPTGNFVVDNFEECQDYLKLYKEVTTEETIYYSLIPSETIYNNIGEEVGEDITFKGSSYPLRQTYVFLGLYSLVYKDEETES